MIRIEILGGIMNRTLSRLVSLFLMGAFILAACGSSNTITPTAIQQQVTEAVQAAATNDQVALQAATPTAVPPTNTLSPTETPLPTETSAPTESPSPTETPVPTITATAVVTPTSGPTSASSGAIAHVNEATYCRVGPSAKYSSNFIALAGTDLNIVSQTTVKNYVVVQNPDNSTQTCWLWTHYVTVNGSISGLPVVTPPPQPTQTADFVLDFYRVEYCEGWAPSFNIINTGSTTLQSYKVEVKDRTQKVTKTVSGRFFDRSNGCSVEQNVPSLVPGQSGFVYAAKFPYDPKGNDMSATVTLCTKNDLEGDCESQVIDFTP
jgi:hypothetical protein